jgi:DNA-directed RNA polymerase subunit N (RpoN/RPB10)
MTHIYILYIYPMPCPTPVVGGGIKLILKGFIKYLIHYIPHALHMIIPVKCYTCGDVLADTYRFYQDQVRKRKLSQGIHLDKIVYMTKTHHTEKTVEAQVLDDLHIHNICCRRHLLTHVDIV